jgi:hypothetical protein
VQVAIQNDLLREKGDQRDRCDNDLPLASYGAARNN